MPVLIEAISIILRREAINKKLPGGWDFFKKAVPEATSCYDNHLARVAFMMPQDAQAYIDHLEQFRLIYLADGRARDLAVVSQFEGIIDPCDWLEFRRVPVPGGGEVAVGRYRKGSAEETENWGQPLEIATPPGWVYEESLSSKSVYVPRGEMDKRLKYLRTENRTEVYLDLETGKEVYAGRPEVPAAGEAGLFNALERIAREVLELEVSLDHDTGRTGYAKRGRDLPPPGRPPAPGSRPDPGRPRGRICLRPLCGRSDL